MSPGELDATVVRRHLSAIRRAVEVLRSHAGPDVSILRESAEERWAVERGLQLCAQNALDVATHIAVGLGRDVSDYGSAIDVLADARVLPRAFVTDFRSVAGFRNVIVHGYLEVDVSVLHAVLNERLDDFLEFADLVEAYLESSPRS